MSRGGFGFIEPDVYASATALESVRQPNPNHSTLIVARFSTAGAATVQLLGDTNNPPTALLDEDAAGAASYYLKLVGIIPHQGFYKLHASAGTPTVISVIEYAL